MSQQSPFGMQTVGPANATAIASRINGSLNALLSLNQGPSTPTYAQVEGALWLDTGIPTDYRLKQYRNGQWVIITQYNPANRSGFFPEIDATYARSADYPWKTLFNVTTGSAVSLINLTFPAGYTRYRMRVDGYMAADINFLSGLLSGSAINGTTTITTNMWRFMPGLVSDFSNTGTTFWACSATANGQPFTMEIMINAIGLAPRADVRAYSFANDGTCRLLLSSNRYNVQSTVTGISLSAFGTNFGAGTRYVVEGIA